MIIPTRRRKCPAVLGYKSMHVPAAHRAHHPRRQPRVQRCTARSNSARRGVSRSGRPHWRGARVAWEAGAYWLQASQPGEPLRPSSPRPSAVRPWPPRPSAVRPLPMIGGGGGPHGRARWRGNRNAYAAVLCERRGRSGLLLGADTRRRAGASAATAGEKAPPIGVAERGRRCDSVHLT